jgi:GT2 family glycosyltransferase
MLKQGGERPLVSLCMATCLRPDLFEESFQSLLAQSYEPLEIIVLVDGNGLGAVELLKRCRDPRVRWFSTPEPSGMITAWNLVCGQSKGKYFLFCADDDVLLAEAIDEQVELMEAHPNVAFCHADFLVIDDSGKEIGRWVSHEGTFIKSGGQEWGRYVVRTGCSMQTVIVRRAVWETVGGWDEDAGNPGDNSLYLKLLRVGDVGHVAKIACKYRLRTRKPDSWQKRLRNHQEFYALSSRHLRQPPPGISVRHVAARLRSRIARATLPLIVEAPDADSKRSLVDWLKREVWVGSPFGRLCAFANRVSLIRLLSLIERWRGNFRARIRNLIGMRR